MLVRLGGWLRSRSAQPRPNRAAAHSAVCHSKRMSICSGAFSAIDILCAIVAGRHQDGQFQVGMAGDVEADLLEAQEAVARMIEGALAALAAEHAVLVPIAREGAAVAPQAVDQLADRAVLEMGADVGAELGDDPAGARLVIAD